MSTSKRKCAGLHLSLRMFGFQSRFNLTVSPIPLVAVLSMAHDNMRIVEWRQETQMQGSR